MINTSNTLLGTHVATGARPDYPLVASRSRGIVSFLADAFLEAHTDTYRVYRPGPEVYCWNGNCNYDGPPGWNRIPLEDMRKQAEYYWPRIKADVEAEKARLGVRIDAIKCTNELNANNILGLQKLMAYEKRLGELAFVDGYVIVFGNLSTNAPHFGLWTTMAEWIKEMWAMGHIYSRHVYFDVPPIVENKERIFKEVAYLQGVGATGPIIIGELGFVTFPGVEPGSPFIPELRAYDEQLHSIPNFGFGATFTQGKWVDAGMSEANPEYAAYLESRPFVPWNPVAPPPDPGPGGKRIAVLFPQEEMTADEKDDIAAHMFANKRTTTASDDDAIAAIQAGNSESFVQVFKPWEPSNARAIAELDRLGIEWKELTFVDPPFPLEGLQLGAPFGEACILTSPFNAPRDYGNGLHEGTDYDVLSGNPDASVKCLYDGTVQRVSVSNGYGNYVVIRHTFRRTEFLTWMAHLDSVSVTRGQVLQKGDEVGLIGATGNARGEHVHINLQVPGYGLSGYVVSDVVNPDPYIASCPTNPAPGPKVDLTKCFLPDGVMGRKYVMHALDGSFTQPMQMHYWGNGVVMMKGNDGEYWRVHAGVMHRDWDTSRRSGMYYRHVTLDDKQWAPWIKVLMAEGEQYVTDKFVVNYNQSCIEVGRSQVQDTIRYVKLHTNWPSPANPAIVLPEVHEIAWIINGNPVESYFMAPNFGYVAFGRPAITEAIGEFADGQQPLQVNPRCFGA